MTGAELRRYQRQAISLRIRFLLDSGELDTFSDGVSRGGFSVRMIDPPRVGADIPVVIYLPAGQHIKARAECRNHRPGNIVGFALELEDEALFAWDEFIDQEEATGSLWRMLNRYAKAEDEDQSEYLGSVVERGQLDRLIQPRGLGAGPLAKFFSHNREQVAVRLHTVGENGEAYRIAFEKHRASLGIACDLVKKLPAFQPIAERSINRVLDDRLLLRLNDRAPIIPVRVCELNRGGFAYVQTGDDGSCGLVSLVLGELLLIEVDGQRMFPFFDDEDLERISCDTVRHDIERPVFRSMAAVNLNPELERASKRKETSPLKAMKGVDAVRDAQSRAELVQTRAYGDRSLRLFPELWARARDREGHEVMGPTMEDGPRVCLLALVGHKAPRVVRLQDDSEVTLMQKPAQQPAV